MSFIRLTAALGFTRPRLVITALVIIHSRVVFETSNPARAKVNFDWDKSGGGGQSTGFLRNT